MTLRPSARVRPVVVTLALLAALLVLPLALAPAPASAATWQLDTTFSDDGSLTTGVGSWGEVAALAIDSKRRIVAAGEGQIGSASNPTGVITLARYKPNGSLDKSFGGDGTVTSEIGGFSFATSVAIDRKGRIVVGGASTATLPATDSDFAIARYKPDGRLDRGFGDGGKLTVDFGGYEDVLYSLAIDAEGGIVAGGFGAIGGAAYSLRARALHARRPARRELRRRRQGDDADRQLFLRERGGDRRRGPDRRRRFERPRIRPRSLQPRRQPRYLIRRGRQAHDPDRRRALCRRKVAGDRPRRPDRRRRVGHGRQWRGLRAHALQRQRQPRLLLLSGRQADGRAVWTYAQLRQLDRARRRGPDRRRRLEIQRVVRGVHGDALRARRQPGRRFLRRAHHDPGRRGFRRQRAGARPPGADRPRRLELQRRLRRAELSRSCVTRPTSRVPQRHPGLRGNTATRSPSRST